MQVALLDTDGVIVAVNEGWRRVAASAASPLGGYEVGVDLQATAAPPLADAVRAVLRGAHGRVEEEIRLEGAAGPAWFRLLVTPLAGEMGPGAVVLLLDESARHSAESALRASEARFRSVVEHALDAILLTDPLGTIVDANEAACRLLGAGAGGLAGQRLAAFVPRVEHLRVQAILEGLRRDGQHAGTLTVRAAGGGVHEVDVSARAEVAPGRHLLVLRDVSERRDLEERLRQAQKMEAVGQLTGGIAHDFNNLLTVIAANASVLHHAAEQLPAELHAPLAELRAATSRGADMVAKLLAFSRQQHLALRPVDLGVLVVELVPILRRVLPASIRVDCVVDAPDSWIRADANAVEQMVLNLATNARDALPQGGVLRLRVTQGELGEAFCRERGWGVPGRYAVLAVEDDGIGMDAATLARVFEPFFTTKAPGAGTGLGLSMVYGLAKQHEGFVDLESTPGLGTRVRVFFPPTAERPDAAQPAAPATATQRRGGGELVLLAEDEELVRRAATRILENAGYRVLPAPDGEEALALFEAHAAEVRLVVCDAVMPRLSGPALIARLRAAGHAVPILCTSGYTERDLQETAVLPADVPFMHKPWKTEELLQRVRGLLDASRPA